MRISRPIQDRIVFTDFPLFSTMTGIGFLMVAVTLIAREGHTVEAWKAIVAVAGTALVTLILVASAKATKFTFDGGERVVIWRRRGLVSRASGTIGFHEIVAVRIELLAGIPRSRDLFRLVVETRSGSVPMTHYFGFGTRRSHARLQEAGQALSHFIREHRS